MYCNIEFNIPMKNIFNKNELISDAFNPVLKVSAMANTVLA